MQRVLGVSGKHGNRLLSKDKTLIDLKRRDMDRTPGHLDPCGECLLHGMPSLERRQKRWMGVENSVSVGLVHHWPDNGPESSHDHKVDLVNPQDIDKIVTVGISVKSQSEVGPDQFDDLNTSFGRDIDSVALSIDDNERYRKFCSDQRLKNRARSRGQGSDSHEQTLAAALLLAQATKALYSSKPG